MHVPQRKNEVAYVAKYLNMYEARGSKYAYDECLRQKNVQWESNMLPFCRKFYATKEYFALYHEYMDESNLNFWNGIRNIALLIQCVVCQSKQKKLYLCKPCKETRYCSKRCQKRDWIKHKHSCVITSLI
eukprot:972561_1